MKKLLIVLALLILGVATAAFAGERQLSDSEMDGINAGDWVVVYDASGNPAVVDVYAVNNTLWLLEQSQKDIKALSNENAIDSATAVQLNIARVSKGDVPSLNIGVNGANSATIANYRPALETSMAIANEHSWSKDTSDFDQHERTSSFALGIDSGYSSSSSHGSSFSSAFGLLETENEVASLAGGGMIIGKSGIATASIAGAYLRDYDKLVQAVKSASCESSSSSEGHFLLGKTSSSSCSSVSSLINSESITDKSSVNTASRESKGANNHILLTAESQRNIRVVSNLNSVASGAAVQTNIASNVGVTGTITHSNAANVSSGF